MPTKKSAAPLEPLPIQLEELPTPSLSGPPEEAPQRCRRQIMEYADLIVRQNIAQALRGNYMSAKFLFEFAGIMDPDRDPAGSARERSFAEEVLARFDLLDAVEDLPTGSA